MFPWSCNSANNMAFTGCPPGSAGTFANCHSSHIAGKEIDTQTLSRSLLGSESEAGLHWLPLSVSLHLAPSSPQASAPAVGKKHGQAKPVRRPSCEPSLHSTRAPSRPLPSGPMEEHDKVIFLRKYRCSETTPKPPQNRVARLGLREAALRKSTCDSPSPAPAQKASPAALSLVAWKCALTRQHPGRSWS